MRDERDYPQGTRVSRWEVIPAEMVAPEKPRKPQPNDLPRSAPPVVAVHVGPVPMETYPTHELPNRSCVRPFGFSDWGQEQQIRDMERLFAQVQRRKHARTAKP